MKLGQRGGQPRPVPGRYHRSQTEGVGAEGLQQPRDRSGVQDEHEAAQHRQALADRRARQVERRSDLPRVSASQGHDGLGHCERRRIQPGQSGLD